MTDQYTITKEQLNALVEIAEWKDAAELIVAEVKANPPPRLLSNNEKKGLPRNPEHRDDGNGLPGLKRIWRWLNYEMSYSDYHFDNTVGKVEKMITKTIKDRQPNAMSEDFDKW